MTVVFKMRHPISDMICAGQARILEANQQITQLFVIRVMLSLGSSETYLNGNFRDIYEGLVGIN